MRPYEQSSRSHGKDYDSVLNWSLSVIFTFTFAAPSEIFTFSGLYRLLCPSVYVVVISTCLNPSVKTVSVSVKF